MSNQDIVRSIFGLGKLSLVKTVPLKVILLKSDMGKAKIFDGEVVIVARDTPRPTGNELS